MPAASSFSSFAAAGPRIAQPEWRLDRAADFRTAEIVRSGDRPVDLSIDDVEFDLRERWPDDERHREQPAGGHSTTSGSR